MGSNENEDYFGTDSDEEYDNNKKRSEKLQDEKLEKSLKRRNSQEQEEGDDEKNLKRRNSQELDEEGQEKSLNRGNSQEQGDDDAENFGLGNGNNIEVSRPSADEGKIYDAKQGKEIFEDSENNSQVKECKTYSVPFLGNTSKLKNEEDFAVFRIPSFLDVKYEEFDEDNYGVESYERELEEMGADHENSKLKIENCIRWRYKSGDNNTTKTIQSNSRLVKWSDDTYSILVGSQLFDASITTNISHKYIGVRLRPEDRAMLVNIEVKKIMALRSHSKLKDVDSFRKIIPHTNAKRSKRTGVFNVDNPEKSSNTFDKHVFENSHKHHSPGDAHQRPPCNNNLYEKKIRDNDFYHEKVSKGHHENTNLEQISPCNLNTSKDESYTSDNTDDISMQSNNKERVEVYQDNVE